MDVCTYAVNVRLKGIEVEEDVDAGVVKSLHAPIVVAVRVDVVCADGVDTKLLHQGSITLALVGIDKGIAGSQLVSNACHGELAIGW